MKNIVRRSHKLIRSTFLLQRRFYASQITTLDATQLCDKIKKGEKFQIIDVRSTQEFEQGKRFALACNIPLNTISVNSKLLKPDEPVVLVCQSGVRSQKAADILTKEHGFKQVYTVSGGMNSVPDEKDLVVQQSEGKKVWEIERQVRFTAGTFVVSGMALGLVHPYFLAIPAFIGCGLIYSAISNTCGMAYVLLKMPWNKTKTCSIKK